MNASSRDEDRGGDEPLEGDRTEILRTLRHFQELMVANADANPRARDGADFVSRMVISFRNNSGMFLGVSRDGVIVPVDDYDGQQVPLYEKVEFTDDQYRSSEIGVRLGKLGGGGSGMDEPYLKTTGFDRRPETTSAFRAFAYAASGAALLFAVYLLIDPKMRAALEMTGNDPAPPAAMMLR